MLNNLFSTGGKATITIFSNPCPQSKIFIRDEISFQNIEEEKMIHEENL